LLTVRWPTPTAAALSCALAAGCGSPTPDPDPITVEICGSSTLGARLVPRLAARWLDKTYAFADANALSKGVRWCVEGTPEGGVPTEICVTYESSGQGLEGIESGSCDVGMYSGPWDATGHSDIQATQVGSDAIMIVTGSSGSDLGDAIELSTLSRWYAGEDVPEGLRVLQRAEAGSGTSAAFRQLLGLEELKGRGVSADGFREATQRGGSFVYYVSAQEQLSEGGFRFLEVRREEGVDAFEPSIYSIAHGYPLVRPLNLLTKQGTTGPAAAFVEWAQSADARPVFEPLFMAHATSADVEAAPVTAECPTSPGTHDVAGSRLGTVYFGHGESRARDDWQLGPIVRASIAAAQRLGKDLAVVGYTDETEVTLEDECALARERAELVHLVLDGELRYMPDEDRPGLRPVVVGGPTSAWGRAGPDNEVAVIMAVDRAPRVVE